MNRRELLALGMGIAVVALGADKSVAAPERKRLGGLLLADLEPDRMWSIYRRYHLLIVGQRDDAVASTCTEAVVGALARYLPASRARLVRAADTRRVCVLIGTGQQDVAIMAAG